MALRAWTGDSAGQLARAAHEEHIFFAIGARRIAPLWRLLDGISDDDWPDAIDMDNAQAAVADYWPDWWPGKRLLIRRVRLAPEQVSADRGPGGAAPCTPASAPSRSPGSQARRFTPTRSSDEPGRVRAGQGGRGRALVPAPHHRGEHLPRQQARRRPPASPQRICPGQYRLDVGGAARRGIAGWLHQLTAATRGEDIVAGHGARGGKAMIATLRRRLIAIPAGWSATPGSSSCGSHPATACSPRSSPACGPSPRCPDHRPQSPDPEPGTREPGATPGHQACPRTRNSTREDHKQP